MRLKLCWLTYKILCLEVTIVASLYETLYASQTRTGPVFLRSVTKRQKVHYNFENLVFLSRPYLIVFEIGYFCFEHDLARIKNFVITKNLGIDRIKNRLLISQTEPKSFLHTVPIDHFVRSRKVNSISELCIPLKVVTGFYVKSYLVWHSFAHTRTLWKVRNSHKLRLYNRF